MQTAASQAVSNAAEALASRFDDQIAPDPALAPATDEVIRPLPNRPSRQVPARNASARLRRPLAVLAALVVGLLASAATVPAAFATIPDPGGAVGYAGIGPGIGARRPRGRHGRHGGLADHLDRYRIRAIRRHRSRTALPCPGRPQGSLRNRLTRAQRRREKRLWRNHGTA